MRPPRLRLAAAAALVAVLAAAAIGVVVATRDHSSTPATARAVPTACAERLLSDWSDGRIDGTYAIRCYRNALESLPADLQVYSSAEDDISQALSQRIVQAARAKPVRKLATHGAKATK